MRAGGAADPIRMRAEELAFVQGMADTRAALDEWNADAWPLLRGWLRASVGVAFALLAAVWLVAHSVTPDPTPLRMPGLGARSTLGDVGSLLLRNCLVLALHAMACVAGFMAGSSLPQIAGARSGVSRTVHEKAARFAILFVVAATCFSLGSQAYVLGSNTATVASHLHTSPLLLIVGLAPHAVPELTALFLPLAAWVIASRRGEWHKLLAATFVTVALALPTLLVSALVEVYVSPHLIHALAGP
jgi:Stage II sporulation protein M